MPKHYFSLRCCLIMMFSWLSTAVVIGAFYLLIGDIFSRGIDSFSLTFLFKEPEQAGRAGGILPILVTTVLILLVALCVSVPVGLGCTFFLSVFASNQGVFPILIRRSLDLLAATPSIVFGLFGSVFFCSILGLGFSILSGGLTLACMLLPFLIRFTEQGLAAVPVQYRLSAIALGMSKTALMRDVLLPISMPTVLAGLLLSVGRALSETAALLFTSGYVMRMPTSFFDSGRTLSVHIFDLAMNVPGGDLGAYRTACILLLLLLVINVSALSLAKVWAKTKQIYV